MTPDQGSGPRVGHHAFAVALVLAASLLVFPWIYHDYFFRLEIADHLGHLDFAKAQMELGRPTTPHHLYHSLLVGIARATGSPTVLPAHAWWLNVAVATLTCLSAYAFIACEGGAPAGFRQAALYAGLALGSSFLWELNALSFWLEPGGRWALGYIRFNTFHSPTLNLLRPLALCLFAAVLAIFRDAARGKQALLAVAIVALVVLSTMAKPNYVLALVPAVVVVAAARLVRAGRGSVRWGLLLVLVAASAGILEHQRNFVFVDQPPLGFGMEPFGVYARWGLLDLGLPLRYLASALFPVVVTLAFLGDARRSLPLNLALLAFVVAVVQANLFVETGRRAGAGNFTWGQNITLYVLFVVALAFFVREIRTSGLSLGELVRQGRFVLAGSVLLLHLANGLFHLTTPHRWG